MKAVRLHRYDERPTVEEVPEPRIQGPHDVLVEIGGAGLCRTDLHIVEGQWAAISGVRLPYTLGHENAGWVREVGSAVEHVAPGDTVILHPLVTCGFCRPCRAGDDMHCENSAFPGIDTDGGMAELLRTSARAVVKLAPGTQPADVAALADAGLTAYHAVKKAVPHLHPGSTCVVLGAGGLGHIGVQCLRALTATTIVVIDVDEAVLELAREWGADHTVLAGRGGGGDGGGDAGRSAVDQVRELTGGKGAEVVLDFVGERGAQGEAWQMTREAGSHYVIGYGGRIEVDAIDVISSERNIVGNLVGTYNELAELMVLAQRGQVTLRTRAYPLDAVNDAISDLDAGRLRGRGILVPSGAGGGAGAGTGVG